MSPGTGLRTWVEISRPALHNNVRTLQSLLGPATSFCAFVKSNAYGHDLPLVVKLLREVGIHHFGVDSIEEAEAIRRIDIDAVIFIVGMVPKERLSEVVAMQCVQDIYDEDGIVSLIDVAVTQQKVALANIEVETGLHRLGVTARDLNNILRHINNAPRHVKLVGLSTHLSSAEDVNNQQFTNEQYAALTQAYETCKTYGLEVPYMHVSNSAATIFAAHTHATMVRVGIAMYGLWPSAELRLTVQRGRAFELQPAMSWKTRIAHVKDVPNGGAIGYDRTYVANRPMRIAVLPVGYWDGYDRALSNTGKVLIHGRLCPVVGRVCMNMVMVDVSAVPHVKVDETATLLGREGINAYTADDMAKDLGTINWEVVTRVNPLIPRIVV